MNLPKNIWIYVKIFVLVANVIISFADGPEPIASGNDPLPFWITIIPVIFFGLFLPPFLCVPETTKQYTHTSAWSAFPFSVFRDPYPFWHLCMWSAFASAIPETYHALTPYNHNQLVMALLMWSFGAGALLGLARTNRGLRREMMDTKPVA